MKAKTFLGFIVFALLASLNSFGQCGQFAKKKCLPSLAPFIHNGQLNNVALSPGESAEIELTFYSGQNYKISLCAQEVLGDVYFKVKTKEGKEVFDSRNYKSKSSWEFNVEATQNLVVEVITPESKSPNALMQSGCVAVLVGFRK